MADQKELTDEGAPAKPPDAPVPPRLGSLRRFSRLGLFAGLFVAALVVSWLFRENVRVDDDPAATPEDSLKNALKKIESVGSPAEHLARGDDALQRHLYVQALSHYEEMLVADPTGAPLVDYRCGLAHESLGQADKSIAAFRKALSAASAPTITFACHLGMARCLLYQNQPAEARRLLYPLLFDETRQQNVPAAFSADAHYLSALALARAADNPSTRLADDNPVAFYAIRLEFPFYLDAVGLTMEPQEQTTAPKQETPLRAQKTADTKPAQVQKVERTGPASDVLDQLAQQAGLRIEWSAGAKKALADRSLRLSVLNWPLVDLLEQAADYFDLACARDGDIVRMCARDEIDAKRLASVQREMTGRALRGALTVEKAHTWTPAVYLELGNLEAARGQVSEAAQWFERLMREAQNSPYVAAASYNLAKLHLRKLDFPRARQALFRVIDQSSGNEMALRAHLRLGQMYLEEENRKDAIVQLRRAQALAPHSPYQPLANLALAAAYLQEERPDQARIVLAKQRASLQKEPYRPTAAFLDAYAQFRLAKATNTSRREASELLSTLWRDQDETLLGPVGHSLIAQAYRDLGFWDQAERLLRQATTQTQGPLNASLTYLLGDTLLKQNRREEAGRLFAKLAATPSSLRTPARLQLAQLDLQDKRFQECVSKCQKLWAEQAVSDPTPLLQIWGAALEGTGDFTKAAQCFAGKAPQ
jgi:tetratricopeptide (TPR) repeat protein